MGTENGTDTLEKKFDSFLKKKTKQTFIVWLSNHTPGHSPHRIKSYFYTETCKQIHTVILFVMDKNWKQQKCSSRGEWINKLWYIAAMDTYVVIRKNTLL